MNMTNTTRYAQWRQKKGWPGCRRGLMGSIGIACLPGVHSHPVYGALDWNLVTPLY